MNAKTHRGIRTAIRARIVAGEWQLGELIPTEAEFAQEYGCSRTTVNRALQALAEEGMVERKRKGGTRVRPLPLPQVLVRIPLLREQIEQAGHAYRCEVLARRIARPPRAVADKLGIAGQARAAYLETLHRSNEAPFAFETRWISLAAVPQFAEADLGGLSANEWLVRMVPFTRGEVALSAKPAEARVAGHLGTEQGAPLFTMDRTTWLDTRPVTTMRLHYAPGYSLDFAI